ncbi:hypothetical protein GQ607_017639 [Colletotrichum asianum]|uniref:Uncharacterized protein n=1 Tax=Colletotrichum asianum TaxID=702518 RepID=A0A8H3VWP2_9PEZI|nr:hypothetical protein GQ607_017639 [Colletotrichum asianum]
MSVTNLSGATTRSTLRRGGTNGLWEWCVLSRMTMGLAGFGCSTVPYGKQRGSTWMA